MAAANLVQKVDSKNIKPSIGLGEKPASPEVATSGPESIIDRSSFLSFGGSIVLMPKGSVLITPQGFAKRLEPTAGDKVVGWQEFLRLNRAWMEAFEITMDQATGKASIPDATRKLLIGKKKVVVTTYEGNPIAVSILNKSQ